MIVARPSERKRLGAYYTPPHLASFMAHWGIRSVSDRVLEPACGDAVFLQAGVSRLREIGSSISVDQIVGCEIDPGAAIFARALAPEATVLVGDFFDQRQTGEGFDLVIGNPPYVRYHYFTGEARSRGLDQARAAGVELSQLTSAWAPFVIHATTFLKPSGRLAFVLPGELLGTDYAESVRLFLLSRFENVHLIAFDERVFPGAMVDALLVLAEGRGPGALNVHRIRDTSALETIDPQGLVSSGNGSQCQDVTGKWTGQLLTSASAAALGAARGHMQLLSEVARVDIGIVTGANDFFVLRESEVTASGFDPKHLHPLVGRSRQMKSYQFTLADWNHQRAADEPSWLFAPLDREGPSGEYIDHGEAEGIHLSYKCRIRKPWWRLKVPTPPDLFLSYMSNVAPRLVLNQAKAVSTNLIHNVRLRSDRPKTDARLLALAWHNSATLLAGETVGRSYGGGVLKLETREAERVIVPRLDGAMVRQLSGAARAIGQALRRGRLEAAVDLVDSIVLENLSLADRDALRRGWEDLRRRRKNRSSPARAS